MLEQLDLFASTNCEETPKEKRVTEVDLQKAHDKKYTQKLLTPEEWELYRFIRENSELRNKKTTQREICDKFGYKYNEDKTAHDPCPRIWTLISHINLSEEIEKVIINDNFTYWIGNEEETRAYLDKLWDDLEPRLIRYWRYLNKIKKNGQGKLISCQNQPIDEDSKAREWVESFLGD